MNKLINGYSYIEVPGSAKVFYLTTGGIAGKKLLCFSGEKMLVGIQITAHAHYEIIGKKLSEDEWFEIVDGWDSPTGGDDYQDYYRNYEIEKDEDYVLKFHFTTATASGLSLLKSLGLFDKYERGELLILKEKK